MTRRCRGHFVYRNKRDLAKTQLLSTEGLVDTVERIDAALVSEEQFIERFEKPLLPVVIRGLTDGWAAAKTWTFPQLARDYGKHRFKVRVRTSSKLG